MPAPQPLRVVQNHTRIGDPHVTTDDADRLSLLHAIVEPLVRRAPGGLYRPGLAARWGLSPDARTWTFQLADGVAFHDGKPLEAGDVVASLTRIRDEHVGGELGTSGVFQSYLAGSRITASEPRTVTLTTPEPTADLLDLLGDIPILSPQAIAHLPDGLIGTGPYCVQEGDENTVVLARHAPSRHAGTLPDAVVWTSVPDPRERLERVLTGEADIAAALSPASLKALGSTDALAVVGTPTSVCATFMCNLIEGVCTHRAVRQALNYALDVPALIDTVMHGAARPLTGPLTHLHLGFDPSIQPYPYDPQRARALLDDAGCGPTLALTLDVPTTLPDEAEALAARMAAYYSDIGIETTVVAHADRPAYAERVRAKRIHDAACFDSSPPSTFRVLREKFHSGLRGPWWLGYDNAEVNRLIDDARATANPSARQKLYRQAYRILHTDAPWIFLYNPIRYFGVCRALGTWLPSPEGYITFT